ncbi:WD40/YVTN/BNR-like repeat-containing protein [Burkholderia vietnamiensis]|uniref:WD40/YVTN/BNR-like repeat-containing protein n=1 Tax=Burkholderia vietnamiensis TaxID=60552 RepID=UPI000752A053|nr:sialidase family protein [Burkholderia vietnamiensis]KVR88924.1 glycosyl hydrolase [Burkholderia vietnamiensis]KVS31476.1 glycosyl hydrolase [Burkholderia vietnamiensis]MBR8204338.1 glycosyl hydrolase [Burkholderia vietnamiensis]MCA8393189.1 glycosyl hydrolase [Burkholderia vietnamiensis]HDR8958836.1 glycosyl hydrolase [Burkholderia vietnamiensis]
MTATVLVATAGQGILRSNDDGKTWHRLGLTEPIEFDGIVRALAVDPATPSRVYAGADAGLCISDDGGAHWYRPANALNGQTVWSIAIDPANPAVLYAGTGAPSRAALYKSTDAGMSWTPTAPVFPEFCSGVNRPRLLTICVDPSESRNVWYGVEEGGAWRSRDGGATWARVDGAGTAIRNSDIHAIAVLPATADTAKTTLLLTVNAVYVSDDDGRTWDGELSRERFDGLYYTRTVVPLATPDGALLMAIGDGTPGTQSRIYRSTDRGRAWRETDLQTPPNSTFWAFGVHGARPELVYAGTKYGHLFRSRDGGRNWTKEWRDFSEITAVAWTPFEAPLVAHAQSTH